MTRYEQCQANFERWVASQPDLVVFNASELTFAAFAICEYFDVDSDDDETSTVIEQILKARGRIIQ